MSCENTSLWQINSNWVHIWTFLTKQFEKKEIFVILVPLQSASSNPTSTSYERAFKIRCPKQWCIFWWIMWKTTSSQNLWSTSTALMKSTPSSQSHQRLHNAGRKQQRCSRWDHMPELCLSYSKTFFSCSSS